MKNPKNKLLNVMMGLFWLLIIVAFGAGNLHPVAFFFNREIQPVTLQQMADGEKKLPLTRWISTEGVVDETQVWEHCHKIYSRVLGDYHTYLLFVVKDGDNFLVVRRHTDAQMTDTACSGGSSFRRVTDTVKTDGDRVKILDREGSEQHTVAIPDKATVNGMLRYRLIMRLPEELTDKYGLGRFSPVLEYGQETSTLSVYLFYIATGIFVISIIYMSKYGTEELFEVALTLKEPDRVFEPGDTVGFKAVINPKKNGVNISNTWARIEVVLEKSFSLKSAYSEELQLAGMAVTQKGKKIVHTGEFVLPEDRDDLFDSLRKKDGYAEWKLKLFVEVKDHITREEERKVKT